MPRPRAVCLPGLLHALICIAAPAKAILTERSVIAAFWHIDISVAVFQITELIIKLKNGCSPVDGVDVDMDVDVDVNEDISGRSTPLACLITTETIHTRAILCLCTVLADPKGAEIFKLGVSHSPRLHSATYSCSSSSYVSTKCMCSSRESRQMETRRSAILSCPWSTDSDRTRIRT
jgi:hypothetical protein